MLIKMKPGKQIYEALFAKVFEVQVEGVICESHFGAGLNQMYDEDL